MNPTLLSLKCVCRTSITCTTASPYSSNFKLGCTLHPLEFITEMLREPLACVSVSPVFIQFSICDHFLCYMLIPCFFVCSFEWFYLSDGLFHFNNLSHGVFVLFYLFLCFCYHPSSYQRTHTQLSNGFDHYSPANSPYLHSNGGSLGSGSGTAFPFFPTSSSSSSTSSSCPTRSWSRPASALLPDYPHYCTLGPMVPSSRVPSWKVCSSPRSWWPILLVNSLFNMQASFIFFIAILLHFG